MKILLHEYPFYALFTGFIIFLFSLHTGRILLLELIRFFERKQLFDQPDARKKHKHPTPSSGGLIFVVPALLLLFISAGLDALSFYPIGALVMLFVGFMDDRFDWSAKLKLVLQLLVVIPMVLELGAIPIFGANLEILNLGITVIFATGFVNAFNLIDGVDGLAASFALTILSFFTLTLFINQQFVWVGYGLMITGMLIAFLNVNWHPAKIFMGDTGSLFLGYTIAFFGIKTSLVSSVSTEQNWLLVFGFTFLPVIDTIRVMTLRLLKKQSPFAADRNHFHHLLQKIGLRPPSIVLSAIIITGLFAFEVHLLQIANHSALYIIICLLLTSCVLFSTLLVLQLVHEKRGAKIRKKSFQLLHKINHLLPQS